MSLTKLTEPLQDSEASSLPVLQSLQAQNVALWLFMLGMLRTVGDDRRQLIREVLDFALKAVREEEAASDSAAAYREALEESLKELVGSLEVYSGDSPHG